MSNTNSNMCEKNPQQCSSTLSPYAPEWKATTTTTTKQPLQNTSTPLSPYQVPPRVLFGNYRGFSPYSFPALQRPISNGNRNVKMMETRKQRANTTVMIRNIPNALRSGFMLKFMDKCCKNYSLEYDFLYLPMDFRTKQNFGYAFVNFTSVGAALKFKNCLQNFKWQSVGTRKICDITWARIQGKQSMIQGYERSIFYCAELDFLPMLLHPPRNGLNENPSPPIAVGTMIPPPGVGKNLLISPFRIIRICPITV